MAFEIEPQGRFFSEDAPRRNARTTRAVRGALAIAGVAIFIWFAWPTTWHYRITGHDDAVAIAFEEPQLTITFEGASPGGNFEGYGPLHVAGLFCVDAGHCESSSGYSERMNYWLGVAEIKVNDRTVYIRHGGQLLEYDGQSFEIPSDEPLSLVIDRLGQVTKQAPGHPPR